ncbi:MAG: hypothetical protein ACKVOJ_06775 [Sphingomonadaceae bacterium]
MKMISGIVVGVALAVGSTALVTSTSAIAAKAEKAAPAKAYKLSEPFRKAIAPVQTSIKAGTLPDAQAKMDAADAIASAPDEKYIAGAVRLELALALKDTAMQARALDGILASGAAPAADIPKFTFFSGNFAFQRGDYALAATKLAEADRLGYKNPDMLLLLAEANFKQNKIVEGLPFVERAIAEAAAKGEKAPESWYQRASSVAYKAKMAPEVAKWTRLQVRAFPTAENWRSAIVIYRDSAKLDGQASLDLMRLMRITKSLVGERDFFEYASLATERALPGEAQSSIEEGFASGAVPRTSRAVNEMLTLAKGKIAVDRASLIASEKQAAGSATGKIAAGTADGFLGYGEDGKAITLYQLALTKGGVDVDAVNTRLGIALARSGQKDAARAAFALVKGPRAAIASFWTLWLDTTA